MSDGCRITSLITGRDLGLLSTSNEDLREAHVDADERPRASFSGSPRFLLNESFCFFVVVGLPFVCDLLAQHTLHKIGLCTQERRRRMARR